MKLLSKKAIVWQIHAIQLGDILEVNGIALDRYVPAILADDSSFSTFLKIVKSYTVNPLKKRKIEVNTASVSKDIETDERGEFYCEIPVDEYKDLSFKDRETGEDLPIVQKYPILFPQTKAKFLLISDIDDTILVSRSSQFFSKLKLMLFKSSSKRKAVEETSKAYQRLNGHENVQFSYVSGSESNLFHLIGSFFMHRELPIAPMHLRPYVNWRQLLKPKHMESYKMERIESLIDDFPDMELLLFGDDSQQDYEVFKNISEKYPEKVHTVFLRKTGFRKKKRGIPEKTTIGSHGKPLYYYDEFDDIEERIEEIIS